ncbi:hypothetical protein [Aureimonas ureilytica]|uniref:hypothetical protein n=1 Tax=Aureimonas ureilytica TaxID=401562 RepID=UPI000B25747E|nr:hypothetical protein [Aureimonas ureilytica]
MERGAIGSPAAAKFRARAMEGTVKKLPSGFLDSATFARYLSLRNRKASHMTKIVDPELNALIREVIEARLIKPGSPEHVVAMRVGSEGLGALTPEERDLFETRVLPILAKPIREQLAIASIVQRGGYVPRKIEF